jgi:hypothetical protein
MHATLLSVTVPFLLYGNGHPLRYG